MKHVSYMFLTILMISLSCFHWLASSTLMGLSMKPNRGQNFLLVKYRTKSQVDVTGSTNATKFYLNYGTKLETFFRIFTILTFKGALKRL